MTMRKLKCAVAAALLAVAGSSAMAADVVLLTEDFNNLTTLFTSGGWLKNNFSTSAPVGDGWFKGNGGQFAAHAGGPDAYIASSVYIAPVDINGYPAGTADGFLRTASVDMSGPTTMSFWTRTLTGNLYGESLYVGALVGGNDISLKAINENAVIGAYPEVWTKYTVYLPGQGVIGTPLGGRFYFEYYIQDTSFAGNYIGVDSVTITSVPEPGSWLLMGLGVAALAGLRRRAMV